MSYPGLCDKYPHLPVLDIGMWTPAVACAGASYAHSGSIPEAAVSGILGLFSGFIGVGGAVLNHSETDKQLTRDRVGLTRGSAIVRRNQIRTYLVATSLSAAFMLSSFHANKPARQTDEKKAASYESIESPQRVLTPANAFHLRVF